MRKALGERTFREAAAEGRAGLRRSIGARVTACRALSRCGAARSERGQMLVVTVACIVALCGMAALVLDVGSWYRSQRELQATADAAALAGAQALPLSPNNASSLALQYANTNGGGVLGSGVAVSSTNTANDTISVDADKQAPGFFSRLLGVNFVDIKARAVALTGVPSQAWGVAPIVVNCAHPLINNCNNNNNTPVFNQPTTIPLSKNGLPGAFDLINLDGSRGGTSPGTMANWLQFGYQGYLGLGHYYSNPGAKFNSSQMQAALNARINTTLLFPVYDQSGGNGANAWYNVIGWIGFYMTGFTARGSSGTLDGYFTTYIAQGILPQSGGQPPWMGVTSIQLIG